MTASIKLSPTEAARFKERVAAHCLKKVPVKSGYEVLRVDDGVTLMILYSSGKLVHNESIAAEEIVDEVLGVGCGFDLLLGSDEAGKGEWYGPLVAVCVAADPDELIELRKMGVRDSKTLPKKKIMEFGEKLRSSVRYKAVVLEPEAYNRMYEDLRSENKTLNDLLTWAHAAAIKELLPTLKYGKAKLVVDRFDARKKGGGFSDLSGCGLEVEEKTRAESEPQVAAASIIAKSIFEEKVSELDARFGLDLRRTKPSEIDASLRNKVAKLHFKNVP